MCLIVVAWRQHPDFPLVVAANRDEYFARPTAAAAAWPSSPGLPQVFGGRDLEAGGTWLAASRSGQGCRFAAVTNVREPGRPAGAHSRGGLTRDFLIGTQAAADYAAALAATAPGAYSGFNLLFSDGDELWYASNRAPAEGGEGSGGAGGLEGQACVARPLPPGIYGVSNHLLDTPWPKLAASKRRFAAALAQLPAEDDLFALLADDEIVPDDALPATGVPLAWERLLSAVFVRSPDYGTRASTLLTFRAGGCGRLHERSFDAAGPAGERLLDF